MKRITIELSLHDPDSICGLDKTRIIMAVSNMGVSAAKTLVDNWGTKTYLFNLKSITNGRKVFNLLSQYSPSLRVELKVGYPEEDYHAKN